MSFQIFAILIETVCGILAFLPFLLLWQFSTQKEQSGKHRLCVFVFAAYLIAVFSVTGMPAFNTLNPDLNINCIPFASFSEAPLQYLLNFLLFWPAGFLLPALWLCFRRAKRTVLVGFGLSLWIELWQLLTFRTTDIDDLIVNTAGTAFGFALWYFSLRHIQAPAICTEKNEAYSELFFLFFGVSFVMFFPQPLLSGWIWEHIL